MIFSELEALGGVGGGGDDEGDGSSHEPAHGGQGEDSHDPAHSSGQGEGSQYLDSAELGGGLSEPVSSALVGGYELVGDILDQILDQVVAIAIPPRFLEFYSFC